MTERCLTQTGMHAFEPRYHTRPDPEIVNHLVDEYESPLEYVEDIKRVAEIREYVYDVCEYCGAMISPPQSTDK
jgi:hypothetical protein